MRVKQVPCSSLGARHMARAIAVGRRGPFHALSFLGTCLLRRKICFTRFHRPFGILLIHGIRISSSGGEAEGPSAGDARGVLMGLPSTRCPLPPNSLGSWQHVTSFTLSC